MNLIGLFFCATIDFGRSASFLSFLLVHLSHPERRGILHHFLQFKIPSSCENTSQFPVPLSVPFVARTFVHHTFLVKADKQARTCGAHMHLDPRLQSHAQSHAQSFFGAQTRAMNIFSFVIHSFVVLFSIS
jgi:hypothetical protein